MKVKLVSDFRKISTGISRYAEMLYKHLDGKVSVEVIPLEPKGISKILMAFGKVCGFDFRTTLKNYPLYLNFGESSDAIWHFTNQQQTLLLNYIKPKKAVVTVHDIIPIASPFPLSSKPGQWLFKLAMKGLKKADRIIADSNSTKKDIIRCCNINSEKIDIVHLGVDTSFFWLLGNREPNKEFRILYTGSDMPRKNVKTLILAFMKFLKKEPNAHLTLVMSAQWPREREKILYLIKKLGLETKITFKHNLTNEELRREYQTADLFVFPSLYEGFGLPVLEAMACGCPVISSDATSLPEVGGEAVLYFNPENANELAEKMHKILTDEKLRKKLIKKGFNRAKKFTWEKTAQKTIKVYKKLENEK